MIAGHVAAGLLRAAVGLGEVYAAGAWVAAGCAWLAAKEAEGEEARQQAATTELVALARHFTPPWRMQGEHGTYMEVRVDAQGARFGGCIMAVPSAVAEAVRRRPKRLAVPCLPGRHALSTIAHDCP